MSKTIEIVKNSDGSLRTNCSYEHSLALDCNECCNGKMEEAFVKFEILEQDEDQYRDDYFIDVFGDD